MADIDIGGDIMTGIMQAVWPFASEHLQSEVLSSIQSSICKSFNFSSLMNVFKFTKSSMGSVVPSFSNFQLVDISDGTLSLTADVNYNGDCHIEAEVGASFAKFPMGIKNVSFNGPIQIELKDLTKKVPFVSAAVFYFIDPPDVDFQMTKGAEIANHPMVAKNMKKLVKDSMANQLLEPSRMVIPLAVSDASVYRFPMPKQILKLTIVEAADLTNMDSGLAGSSDAFVMIYLDPANQSRTEIVKNELNPVWNHECIFTLYRSNSVAKIDIMDSNDISEMMDPTSFITDNIPKDTLDSLPFGLGDKVSEKLSSGFGGFGGFGGMLGGFTDKIAEIQEKVTEVVEKVPVPGLEEKIKEYSEEKLGSCRIKMKQLSDKTSDQWIDLKGPNSGSGKIHIQHLYFEKTSEINFEEEFKIVFQYYLKEVEGLLGVEEEVYCAEVCLSTGEVIDLGFSRLNDDQHHNFATFDRANYLVLPKPQAEISGQLKISLCDRENKENKLEELGSSDFAFDLSQTGGEFIQEITHRTKFGENSSVRGRIQIQVYQ